MLKKAISFIGSFANNAIVEPIKKSSVKTTLLILVAFAVVSFSSCKKDQNDGNSFGNRSTSAVDYPQSSLPVVSVPAGSITTAVHWTAGNVYEINGVVTVQGGGVLTIDAGTFIKSTVGSGSANGVLVVAKDGTIHANGTDSNPVVFTSYALLDGNDATVASPGQFGGVIILGDAPINVAGGSDFIEGLPATSQFSYGGSDASDNRGNFTNVRIEFAGYELEENIEINGLTLGGVGTGTTINNVEVAWGLDDGFEFFGGTVNVSDLVAFSNDDDGLDFDQGYVGSVTNAMVIMNNNSTHSQSGGISDSNGMEIDNNVDNPCGATPITNPVFTNVRIVGTQTSANAANYRYGVFVRRGAQMIFDGGVVTGFNRGLVWDGNCSNGAATEVSGSTYHGFLAASSISLNPASVWFTDFGANTPSTAATAPNGGMPQPFFNVAGFNPGLSYGWVKFTW